MKGLIILQRVACFLLFLCFLTGIHRLLFTSEENKCDMTYMFEYPQYIKVSLNQNITSAFPNYELFVYGEGDIAERYRNRQYEGVPILFIPGNGGSYKQVRSLGSVAYRKALERRKGIKIDFFTIDFNNELSALSGGILLHQLSFTKEVIKTIVSLYKRKDISLVLVGHSMGGMIARAAVNEFSPVSTIITLATPHEQPVVTVDRIMAKFYQDTLNNWSREEFNRRTTLISIGGAERDIQVRSGLTMSNETTYNVLTTGIPGAWVSTDHLCIVWCKQIVITIVRMLFDLIDSFTENWVLDFKERSLVIEYHLSKRYAGKSVRSLPGTNLVEFDPNGKWREVIASQFVATVDQDKVENTYFMIPLIDNAYRDRLVAVSKGLPSNWVFGCVATAWRKSVRFCERGINLSDQTTFLPIDDQQPKRKFIYLDLIRLREEGHTHVIFNIPKTQLKGMITIDVHSSNERNLLVKPTLSVITPKLESLRIPAETLSYNITLPEFTEAWQSFFFKFEKINNCLGKENKVLIKKIVPWSWENQFYWTNNSIEVYLHKPKSFRALNYEPSHVQVLNPNQCNLEISISYSWSGVSTQLVRFYYPMLLPLLTAIFIFCFFCQLRDKSAKIPVRNIVSCLLDLPVFKTALWAEGISFFLSAIEAYAADRWPFPESDISLLRAQSLSFPLMFGALGAVAWATALVISVIFLALVAIFGNVFHTIFIRYLRSYLGLSSLIAELLAVGLSRLPLLISITLIAIGASTCGSLTLLIGFFICVWKLFSYYEDELESILVDEEDQNCRDDEFKINATVTLLWLCMILFSLPSLVVWIRNPQLSLEHDPVLYPGFLWSFSGVIVFHKSEEDRPGQIFTHKAVEYVILALSLASLCYGVVSVYRMLYFITATVVAYSVKLLI